MSRNLSVVLLSAATLLFTAAASAVYLDPDGTGQVLIFPYYTVQPSGTDAYNTLFSVANTGFDAKVLKVRFREGLNGEEVYEANVYLGGNDMWTAAVVPDAGGGARIVTRDGSCTNPGIPEGGHLFNFLFAGTDDGLGSGAARTREGYFEVFEMGTLSGTAADAAQPDSTGKRNCAALQDVPANLGTLGAPTGGLYGTATLIDVATGLDVTYTATALDQVASKPMYSDPGLGSPKPDYNSPEIDPVASIVTGNTAYRLVTSSGSEAIAAVLAVNAMDNEYVLDSATASKTDWVETHPLHRFNLVGGPTFANGGCVDPFPSIYDRDQGGPNGVEFPERPPSGYMVCWASTVIPVRADSNDASTISGVLASRNTLAQAPTVTAMLGRYPAFYTRFPNGRITVSEQIFGPVTSTAGSTATNLATGAVTTGSFLVWGTATVGFVARTFVNANVSCGGVLCQATYSAAMPHRRTRNITRN